MSKSLEPSVKKYFQHNVRSHFANEESVETVSKEHVMGIDSKKKTVIQKERDESQQMGRRTNKQYNVHGTEEYTKVAKVFKKNELMCFPTEKKKTLT